MLRALFWGNIKILSFWIHHMFKLWNGLPSELTNSNTLTKRMETRKPFVLNVKKSLITQYNADMEQLGDDLQSLHNNEIALPFNMRQIGFFIVRTLVFIAAFYNYRCISFMLSLLQFIVVPYSLSISIGYGIETSLALFSGHTLIFPIIKYFVDLFCPTYLNISIPFSPMFAVIFIVIDQCICALCLIQTPKGSTKRMDLDRVCESVWFGFLNCKTYYLVLISLLFGQSLPLTAWVIDAVFGISGIVSRRIMGLWDLQFYHIHRISHVNIIYADAHKFHHCLHDTTAFDAHIFGSGAPEEWLLIVFEYLIAGLCGGLPPSMSYYVLTVSWINKVGHTRSVQKEYHCDNYHADHHTGHTINFGNAYPLDILFKTTSNREHGYRQYRIKRVESDGDEMVSLQFVPSSQAQGHSFHGLT